MQPVKERAAAFPVSQLPGSLPTANIPEDTDHARVVQAAVKNLSLGLRACSLTEGAQWRDLLALTGSIRTFFPIKCIEAAWSERSKVHEPTSFCAVPGTSRIMHRGPKISWVQGGFSFATHGMPQTECSGLIGLVPDEDSSSWKIWFVITILERIHGLSNVDVLEPDVTPELNRAGSAVHIENGQLNGTRHTHDNGANGYPEANGYAKTYGNGADVHTEMNGHAKTGSVAETSRHVRTNGNVEAGKPVETNGYTRTNGHEAINGHGEINGSAILNGDTKTNEHFGTNGQIEFFGDTDLHCPTETNGNGTGNETSLKPGNIDFDCVVCGGGQAGLVVAGRLKAGGIPNCIAIDRNDVIGGNWLARYDSVKLHTSKDISQLPFGRIFPLEDPYYLGKHHLARGYQKFVKQFGLNIWTSTVMESASYDDAKKAWILNVVRNGERLTMSTKHFVLAVGPGGTVPKMPKFVNRESFKGEVMHSINYMNCESWTGKKAVIVGAANTAHDIAEDMVHAGLESVTMIQRGATCVVPAEYMRANIEPLYSKDSDIEAMDRIYQSMPTALARLMLNYGLNSFAVKQPERFDALEKAGYKVEREIDMIHILYERVGGHHMDVGASAMVISGQIKMKSDAQVSGYTPTGLVFNDGSELDADIVIFATGYEGNPREQVASIVGVEMEEKLEDMWCCDKEGEVRGLWKPIGHPGIWYAGGGIGQTRFYSRFLALQIQADLAGTPLPVYLDTPKV